MTQDQKRQEPLKLTASGLPQVIEFSADGTAQGKSLAAWRTRYFLDQYGIPNAMVTIESRGVAMRHRQRKGDVFIATEDFAKAPDKPGGLAGVLRPLFDAIERAAKSGAAVIIDWGGGLAQHRLQALAATEFDVTLSDLKMAGLSVIVTTATIDRMREAADNLTKTREIVPDLRRALLLNDRNGEFTFFAGTAAATTYQDLLKVLQGDPIIKFPAVEGESLQECEQAGLSLPAVIRATPGHITQKTRLDRFTARAVRNEIEAWWDLTDTSLSTVFRFRAKGRTESVSQA